MLRKALGVAFCVAVLTAIGIAPAGAGAGHPTGSLGCGVTGHVSPLRVSHNSVKMQLKLHGTDGCPIGFVNGIPGTITGADAVATWTTKTPSCAQPFGVYPEPKSGIKAKVTWTGSSGAVYKATMSKMYAADIRAVPDAIDQWDISGRTIKSADFKGALLSFTLTIADPDYYTNCAAHPNQPADEDVTGHIWAVTSL